MDAVSPSYPPVAKTMSARKQAIRRLSDASAPERAEWLARAAFFHDEDLLYLKFLIPEGARVLELGCGTGDLLAALAPSFGVGVDFSEGMIGQARKAHPDLTFLVGDIEDAAFVAAAWTVRRHRGGRHARRARRLSGHVRGLHALCTRETRLVIGHFSHLWYPALRSAEAVGLKMPQPAQNVLAPADVRALAALADFEAVKSEARLLLPVRLLGLGRLVNRFLAPFPLIRRSACATIRCPLTGHLPPT